MLARAVLAAVDPRFAVRSAGAVHIARPGVLAVQQIADHHFQLADFAVLIVVLRGQHTSGNGGGVMSGSVALGLGCRMWFDGSATYFTRQHPIVLLASVDSGFHVKEFAARRTRRADVRTLRQVPEGAGDDSCLFDVTLRADAKEMYAQAIVNRGEQTHKTHTFSGYCPW